MSEGAGIRIRMYRVGFGDCFLLSIPAGEGMEHVLIDCGVHPGGNIGMLERAVQNVAAETQGNLALVVGTHAHADHLSGFADYADMFRQFKVREVWLPWTEDPNDKDAAALKNQQTSLVHALGLRFAARAPSRDAKATLDLALSNDAALAFLKSGFAGATVTYVSAGKEFRNVAGIPGLSATVLGPPRSAEFLARMDPPDSDHYLRAAPEGEWEVLDDETPFTRWTVAPESPDFPAIYKAIDETEKNALAVAATDAEMLAFTLDQIVNNTSVVALFEFRGKHLLFAGDAQYGNWKSWMEQPEGKTRLAQVCFYKVAHHGSLNATPKSALDAMPQGQFAVMASTQVRPWKSIPRPGLWDAIVARSNGAVRSDSIPVPHAPAGPPPAQLPANFQQGEFWYDCVIPV